MVEKEHFVTKVPTLTTIDKNAKREYSIHRFQTIRERTVYRIVMAKFRSSTMFSMK